MDWLAKSLQLRHVDAGSCNGCEQELTALSHQRYDMQRYGIDVVASPRHADALVITGPVTDTMLPAATKVWNAVSEPKLLVALGDCAAGCGVFQNAYASRGGVATSMGTPDLVIKGCPPSPDTILTQLIKIQQNRLSRNPRKRGHKPHA